MSSSSLICELARQFYDLGWVTGTGGGLCIREGERVIIAPSGVQKERMTPEQMFTLAMDGTVLERPADPKLKPSECSSLFLTAIRLRNAGAVIHTHSMHAMLATLLFESEFVISEIEMIKGIQGMGYHDRLIVPIIENTARESELAESLQAAIEAYPETQAVLVRRHGVYVWGRDWVHAKTQTECYDYLFRAAVEMRHLGIPTDATKGASDAGISSRPAGQYARR
ncbi:MAG: methylthioribulose 1-phosphate dehydratase [Thermoanaerobaculia bacterium]|nr:methylthioribulose 1-phosphate dehydratase [Thermoanaerobaculia bacterium]